MKTISAIALLLGSFAAQADLTPTASGVEKDAWEKTLERILSKEGIEMGGVFRAQYLHSSIGGPSVIPTRKTEESVEFTSVDFDIKARPNTATQARVIFRMHQDWRNFFSDVSNPIVTRWISLDGNAAQGMFSYHAGDFRRRYSPLTLWSPDIEVPYEPAVFANERKAAMGEVFLGDNDRLLQGVDLNLDAQLVPIFSALHLNLLGSRLRNVETNIGSGSKVTAFIERSFAEKYLGAGNLDVTVRPGVDAGFSYLNIFDKKGSFEVASMADTAAQGTQVIAGRAGVQLEKLLDAKNWQLQLAAEYAQSADDTSSYADTLKNVTTKTIDGSALNASLTAGWSLDDKVSLKLTGTYIKNEANYRNELAQSPTFLGERIMNIENDTAAVRTNTSRARHYSTIDALYRTVFKFAPSNLTNMWHKAPFTKNSYSRAIMTQSEMAVAANSRLDSAVQLVMPFGPATPNRVGPQAKLEAAFLQNKIGLSAKMAMLEEVEALDTAQGMPLSKFAETGFGGKVEVGDFIGLKLPLTLSGYFALSSAENDGLDSIRIMRKTTTQQLHAGLYWGFLKRFALMGGYMQFNTDYERAAAKVNVTQSRIAGGLEYKIAEGAYVNATIGQVDVKRDDALGDFDQLQTSLDMRVGF